MSILQFKVQADYEEVIRLREEISRLETTLKNFGPGTTEATINALKAQLSECRAEFRRLADEAARSGADLERNINNQLANIRKNSTVNVKIQADNQQFHQAMEQQGKDFQEAMRNLEMYGSKVTSVFTNLSRFAGFTAPLAGLMGFFSQVKETRSYFQDIESTMTTLLGAEEKSAEFCEKLEKAAYYNMFEYSDLVGASKQMIAYGVATDQIIPKIDQLSEVATATKANLGEMVGMYTRAKAIGYVDSRALQTWASHGLVVKDVMKEMGIQAKGNKVTFDQLNQVLEHVTSEGGMFHGVMNSQMQNISAEIGQLEDNTSLMFNDIGKSIQEPLRQVIKFAGVLVEHWRQVAIAIGGAVAAYAVIRTTRAAESAQFNKELDEAKQKLDELNRTQEKKTYDKDISDAMKNGIISQEDGDKLQDARNELDKKGATDKDLEQIIAEKEAEIQMRREAKAAIDEEREALEQLIMTQNGEQPRTLDEDLNSMVNTGELSDDEAQAMQEKRDAIDDLIKKRQEEYDVAKKNYEASTEMVDQLTKEKEQVDDLVNTKQDALSAAEESGNASAIEAAQSELNAATIEQERVAEELEMATQMQSTSAKDMDTAANARNTLEKKKGAMVSNTAVAAKKLETAATKTGTVATEAETVSKQKGVVATKASIVWDKAATAVKHVYAGAINIVKTAWNGLKAAFATNPFGLILTVVSTAIGLFMSFRDEEEKVSEETERFGESAIKTKDNVDTLYSVLETVSKGSKVYKDALAELEKIANEHGFVLDDTKDKYTQLLALRYQMIDAIYQEGEAIQAANHIQEYQNTLADRRKELIKGEDEKGGLYKQIKDANKGMDDTTARYAAEMIAQNVDANREVLAAYREDIEEINKAISDASRNLDYTAEERIAKETELGNKRQAIYDKMNELTYGDAQNFLKQRDSSFELPLNDKEFHKKTSSYISDISDIIDAEKKWQGVQKENTWEEPKKPFNYDTATIEEFVAKVNEQHELMQGIGKTADEVASKDMTPKIDGEKLRSALVDIKASSDQMAQIKNVVLTPDFDPKPLDTLMSSLKLTETQMNKIREMVLDPKTNNKKVAALCKELKIPEEKIKKINDLILAPGFDPTPLESLMTKLGFTEEQIAKINNTDITADVQVSGLERLDTALGVSLGTMQKVKDFVMNPTIDIDPFGTLLDTLDLTEDQLDKINEFVASPDFDPNNLHDYLVKLGITDDKIKVIDNEIMKPDFNFTPLRDYLEKLGLTEKQINIIDSMVMRPDIAESSFGTIDKFMMKLSGLWGLMQQVSGWKLSGGGKTEPTTKEWFDASMKALMTSHPSDDEVSAWVQDMRKRVSGVKRDKELREYMSKRIAVVVKAFPNATNQYQEKTPKTTGGGGHSTKDNSEREEERKKRDAERALEKARQEEKKRKDTELRKRNIRQNREEDARQEQYARMLRAAEDGVESLQDGIDKTIAKINLDSDKQIHNLDELVTKKVEELKDIEKQLWLLEDEDRHELDWVQTKTDEEYEADAKRMLGYTAQMSTIIRNNAKERTEAYKDDLTALREYLKQYGSFEAKKLALTEEYEEKIRKARNSAEQLQAKKELEEGLKSIEFEALQSKIDWYSVFSNIGIVLESQLDEVMGSLKKFISSSKFNTMSASDQKVVAEAYNKLMTESNSNKADWDALAQSIADYVNAQTKYEEQKRGGQAYITDYTKAKTKYDNAEKKLGETLKVGLDKDKSNSDTYSRLIKKYEEIQKLNTKIDDAKIKLASSSNDSEIKSLKESIETLNKQKDNSLIGIESLLDTIQNDDVQSAFGAFVGASNELDKSGVALANYSEELNLAQGVVSGFGTKLTMVAEETKNAFDPISEFLGTAGLTQLKELWDAFNGLFDLFKERDAYKKAQQLIGEEGADKLADNMAKVGDEISTSSDNATTSMGNLAVSAEGASKALAEIKQDGGGKERTGIKRDRGKGNDDTDNVVSNRTKRKGQTNKANVEDGTNANQESAKSRSRKNNEQGVRTSSDIRKAHRGKKPGVKTDRNVEVADIDNDGTITIVATSVNEPKTDNINNSAEIVKSGENAANAIADLSDELTENIEHFVETAEDGITVLTGKIIDGQKVYDPVENNTSDSSTNTISSKPELKDALWELMQSQQDTKEDKNDENDENKENSESDESAEGKTNKLIDTVGGLIKKVGDFTGGFAGKVIDFVLKILDILKDGIGTLVSSLIDTIFDAIIGILDDILNIEDGLFRKIGESIYKGIMGIFKSIFTLGGLFDWIHGGESDATLEEDIERLTAVNESLCDAISKLSDDLREVPLADAAEVYKTQTENLKQSMKNTQEMMYRAGASHSSGFFGIGSERSSNHKIDREMTSGEWSRASKAAGVNINSAWQFFHLTSEQMAKIAKEAPDIYGKIKDLASKGHKDASQFMDDFIAYAEELEELKKSYWEVITDTNFDSVASQFKSTLLDMESSAEDFTNSFEEMMRQAVINSMMANTYNDMISEWYENFAKAMENDGLSDDEQRKLKKEYDEIVAQAIDERDNVIKAMGWEDSITQQATSRGVQGMSQDTGNAIEGRLTAIQIATEAIRANHNMQSTSLADIDDNMLLLMQSDANRSVMYENLERHVAKIYLEVMGINENTAAMVKPVLTMQLDLEQIKRNTNKL